MTKSELSQKLQSMYRDAPKDEGVTMILLFGIRYADEIQRAGLKVTDIVRGTDIPKSYSTEVSKGVRLARHVQARASPRE